MMKTSFLILFPLVVLAQTPKFEAQVIDNQLDIGYGLAIGDVDGDRKPDILLADKTEFVWYRNGDWKRFVMAQNLTPQDNVCIAARDLDGDGRVEVAVGAGWDPSQTRDPGKSGAVFYLIRPNDPTQPWEPVRLHHEVTTHRMRWARVGPNQWQLIVVPLHGLNNQNGEGPGVRIYGYELPTDVRKPWPLRLVDSTMHITHNFEIWEDGPQTRLLVGGKEGGRVFSWKKNRWEADRWLVQNLGGAAFGLSEVRRGSGAGGRTFVAAVSPFHGNQLVILTEASGQNSLTDKLAQGHALVCGDFLKTGRSQVAVGWRMPNGEKKFGVRLWVPGADGNWTEHPVDDRIPMACEDLQAADLDDDGDLDLIASGRSTLNLLVYWNKSEKP